MIQKDVLFFGQPCTLACDALCSKARWENMDAGDTLNLYIAQQVGDSTMIPAYSTNVDAALLLIAPMQSIRIDKIYSALWRVELSDGACGGIGLAWSLAFSICRAWLAYKDRLALFTKIIE